MFEKGITSENRTFIDRLTSTYIITFIIMLTPSAIFMMYRNDFGPFENLPFLSSWGAGITEL